MRDCQSRKKIGFWPRLETRPPADDLGRAKHRQAGPGPPIRDSGPRAGPPQTVRSQQGDSSRAGGALQVARRCVRRVDVVGFPRPEIPIEATSVSAVQARRGSAVPCSESSAQAAGAAAVCGRYRSRHFDACATAPAAADCPKGRAAPRAPRPRPARTGLSSVASSCNPCAPAPNPREATPR